MVKKSLNAFLTITTAFFISACTPRTPPETLDLAAYQKIGITSFCGKSINREDLALFNIPIFDDHSNKRVSEWELDDIITQTIKNNSIPEWTIHNSTLNEDLLMTAALDKDMHKREEARKQLFASLPAKPKHDLIIGIFPKPNGVVWSGTSPYLIANSIEGMSGFGLFTRARMKLLHAYCGTALIDPHARRFVRIYASAYAVEAGDNLDEATWNEYTPEQMTEIRKQMEAAARGTGAGIINGIYQDPYNINKPATIASH